MRPPALEFTGGTCKHTHSQSRNDDDDDDEDLGQSYLGLSVCEFVRELRKQAHCLRSNDFECNGGTPESIQLNALNELRRPRLWDGMFGTARKSERTCGHCPDRCLMARQ